MQRRNKSILLLSNVPEWHSLRERAEKLFSGIRKQGYYTEMLFRKGKRIETIIYYIKRSFEVKPEIVYLIDFGYSTVIPILVCKPFLRFKLILDTGDIVSELLRSTGRIGLMYFLIKRLESFVWWLSDVIIVRGKYFEEFLKNSGFKNAFFIPDGVDTDLFKPMDASDLRRSFGLEGILTVGFVGTLNWVKKHNFCYGWELLSALRCLRDYPVKGIIIGDGDGLEILKKLAKDYSIEDKVLFLGRVPYENLPKYINLIDVCLSTQSNDIVGKVRTTGKLPLYMACGRYIIATKAGTAMYVLPEEMLLDYKGVRDESYPERLASAIKKILSERDKLNSAKGLRMIAEKNFDYNLLSKRVDEIILKLITYGKV